MDFFEFKASLQDDYPPVGISNLLVALWHDKKGDWEAAHNISQDVKSPEGSLVHAYLHRKERDLSNASYWYSRAGRKLPAYSLDEEWVNIVQELL